MLREFRREARLMGSAFEFIVVDDGSCAGQFLDIAIAEVQRIEMLLTEFSDDSQTALLNRAAGLAPVVLDDEVYALLRRCIEISRLTQGAFDITAGALKKLYNFKGGNPLWPDAKTLEQTLQKTGYQHVHLLDSNRAMLALPGMHIGFGAIGKGYAADCVRAILQKEGVCSAVVNASGDLTAFGKRADGEAWKVGIAAPDQPDRIALWLPVDGVSVATSGDYEQFFEHEGVRYAHNIDPKTGRPVSGVKSITVVSPSAELSDALATAVFVMGREVGLHFIGQLPQVHCVVIDMDNQIHVSKNLEVV